MTPNTNEAPAAQVRHQAARPKEFTMMFWYGDSANGWGYALMIVSMIAFWGLIVSAVFYMAPSPGRTAGRPKPREILAERFAKGEITEDEYRGALDTLRRDARFFTKS